MENVAVLPVPDWACAMTSRPLITGTIARCCIADGFSNPEVASRVSIKILRKELKSNYTPNP